MQSFPIALDDRTVLMGIHRQILLAIRLNGAIRNWQLPSTSVLARARMPISTLVSVIKTWNGRLLRIDGRSRDGGILRGQGQERH